MGGIRISRNFLGTNTIKAGVFSFGELTVKTAPFFLIFYGLGQTGNIMDNQTAPVVIIEGEATESAPVRRASLMEWNVCYNLRWKAL